MMAAMQGGEHVYATLLLTDSYLPGALVLAHSLRDAGTTKKLAVLVTLDTLSVEVITQLKAVYDYVIPVSRIQNEHPANLHLMGRPDLHSAFTKLNLWKQTQFGKIVYIDSDVVAYRAPDELFELPHAFSAAPDIGWPDLFNTGVMVLTPDMGEYYALMAMAERGVSFDGADQGLLNMHFKNSYNRISFSYNVTPSAHYQYLPAYRHFQSTISMAHFIGPDKPWTQGRDANTGTSPYAEMTGRWWAVYDKHYRSQVSTPAAPATTTTTTTTTTTQVTQRPPELVQYFVKGEYQPTDSYVVPVGEPHREQPAAPHGHHQETGPVHHDEPEHHRHEHHDQSHHPQHEQPQTVSFQHQTEQQHSFSSEPSQPAVRDQTEAPHEQASGYQDQAPPAPHSQPGHKPESPKPQPAPSWDAQRHPPPADSKPEALNFPQTHYEMSSDVAPFVPPERYPSPPKNLSYQVPAEPPAPASHTPKAIFPWETHRPRASRVFLNATPPPEPVKMEQPPVDVPSGHEATTERPAPAELYSSTDSPSVEAATTATVDKASSATTASPTSPSDPWSSFPRTNAWDEVPEINRYVGTLQQHRRTRSRGLRLGGLPPNTFVQDEMQRRGSRVTDFPSELERPSLPVTPAPVRRPKLWGTESGGATGQDGDDQWLPAASGVPAQTDWVCVHGCLWSPADCLCDLTNVLRYHKDPVAQLQKLAREQSELLLRKLSGSGLEGEDDYGASGSKREDGTTATSRSLPAGSEGVKSPTGDDTVLSPQPVKPGSPTGSMRTLLRSEPEATARTAAQYATTAASTAPGPSYAGPGLVFEKGEDVPTSEAPALPTEEELDVLET